MKGAPERILEHCTTILIKGEKQPMSDRIRAVCEAACLDLAAKGNGWFLNVFCK